MNDRNELTGASRQWPDNQSVNGQQYGYAYDNLGNRQSGGDAASPTLYTANNLNQYTGILTPGLQDIMGAALATNSVTVNGGLADRHGEYFHRQISVANTNQAVWQEVTNISGTFTNQGGLVFPANNQTLVYDADGNLSFDGVWNYQWDGENRLISMTMTNVANIAATNRLRLDFAYDYLGRRISKIVSVWNQSTFNFQPSTTNYFIYDGWNLLAEVGTSGALVRGYTWGTDLSGTMTGAGGVGGLLMANLSGTNCFTAYDGNGNITALVNAGDKTVAARYEYSPYGELLRETGLLAHQMPFRFSTKFWDEESGFACYDSRFYSPTLGKWINRDPTTDKIYLNLYLFCQNNPLIRFDRNGCDTQLELDFSESIGAEIDGDADVAAATAWSSLKLKIGLGAAKGVSEKMYDDVLKYSNAKTFAKDFAEGALEGGIEGAFSGYVKDLSLPAKLASQGILQADFMAATEGKLDPLKLGIGMAIGAHETDDEILNTVLDLGGSMGVDDVETILGIAGETHDASN